VLRTIASCELDAALLDVRFGEASILPAAIALKAKKIPYILTTGSRDLTDLPALLANAPLLTKPFDARRLEMMMGTALLASDGAAPHRL